MTTDGVGRYKGAMRRLLPDPGPTTVADQLTELDFQSLTYEDRPYTVTNFALTVDGRATLHGRSGEIAGDVDTELLVGLRTRVDAVMIGAGTMRAERYGRVVPNPLKRARRERAGFAHDPLFVIVTDSMDLPWDAGAFTCGGGHILIFTSSDAPAPEVATKMRVERRPDGVDLAEVCHYLRTRRGIRALLSEGGPHLHGGLIAGALVDELFVTTGSRLAGGTGPSLVEGLPEGDHPVELAWLLEEEGELYARYRLPRPRPG